MRGSKRKRFEEEIAVTTNHGVSDVSDLVIPASRGAGRTAETLCARSVLYGIPPDLEDTMKVRNGVDTQTGQSFGSIAAIFRGPFLEKVATGTHARAILELANYYSDFHPPSQSGPLSEWFDSFYTLLFERYRCEYVYKNAIASKIFLSRHSLQDSYMTDELRSGASRADVVILNGTSTVYEIKSQFDSFDRLPSQLNDYRRIFDLIYIVTTVSMAAPLSDIVTNDIGVIVMRQDGSLSTVRKALSNRHNTDPAAIFDCMRQEEFCKAVTEACGPFPKVPNSEVYRVAKNLFCSLPPYRAHDLMVRHLKRRGKKKPFEDLIRAAPVSLKHACLSFTKSQAMAQQIQSRLKEPIS
jgi:sRNA-binding regulator protein Hfq